MDTVLSGLIVHNAMVYLDDIVIYSNNTDEHNNHIRLVFDRSRKVGLRLNTNKCHFGLREVKLLGFIVSEKGVTTDPDKFKVIKNLPAPTSVKQVRSLVGACSYYRSFVPDLSKTAEDLIQLTRNKVKFHWGPDQEIAFNKLKDLLVSSDGMAALRLDKPYKLYTDGCGYAVGGILVQDDENGIERVIHYVSHSLSSTQRKWSVCELEGYAIVYCINKLRPYLYGAVFRSLQTPPLRSPLY